MRVAAAILPAVVVGAVAIIRRQPLPGYTLFLEAEIGGRMLLAFEPTAPCGKPVNGLVLSGTRTIVPSGTRGSCYREPKQGLTHGNKTRNRALNLESNQESNFEERARDVENVAGRRPNQAKKPSLQAHVTDQALRSSACTDRSSGHAHRTFGDEPGGAK